MNESKKTIGRYKVVRELGQGGMGRVLLVRDPSDDREWALKLLEGYDSATLDAFREEFRLLARLDHRNLVTVHEFGIFDEGTSGFTMEVAEGENLVEVLQTADPEEATRLVIDVLRGLAHIHARGIVHLDIKPHNLPVVEENGRRTAKLLDFGLAGLVGGGDDRSLRGTLHYLSPEMARGLPVDARTDLYGLGVLLYRAWTGRMPYEGDSFDEVLARIRQGRRPDFSDLDAPWREIVKRLMDPEPGRRYASAEEAMAAIGRLVGDSFGIETGDGPTTRFRVARLVGREEASERLRAVWEGETTRFLILAGPPDSGKSRLLRELRVEAETDGATWFEWSADPEGGGLLPGLRALISHLGPDSPVVEAEAPALLGVFPELADLLEQAEASNLGAKEAETRLALSCARLLHAAGNAGDVVWVLRDWESSRPREAAIVRALARERPADGRLLALLVRSGSFSPDHPGARLESDLLSQEDAERLELRPLTRDEGLELLAVALGDEVPEALVQAYDRVFREPETRQPGRLLRFLDTLAGLGHLRRERRGWVAEVSDEELARFDPARSRIDLDDEEDRSLLGRLAIPDESLTLAELRRIGAVSEGDEERLHQLMARGFVLRDQLTYSVPPAVRRAAMEDWLEPEEAEELRTRFGLVLSEERPLLAGRLLAGGTLSSEALDRLLSLDLGPESHRILGRAEGRLERLDPADRIRVLEALGRARLEAGHPGAERSLGQLVEGLRSEKEEGQLSRALGWLAQAQSAHGRPEKALETIREALERAGETAENRPELLVQKSRVHMARADYEAAARAAEEARSEAEEVSTRSEATRIFGAAVAFGNQFERFDEAEEGLKEVLNRAETPGDRMAALNALGVLYDQGGRREASLAQFEEALRVAEEVGAVRARARAMNNTGLLLLTMGRFEAARERFEAAIDQAELLDNLSLLCRAHTNLARSFRGLERPEEAIAVYGEAFHSAQRAKDPAIESVALAERAEVEERTGHEAQALDDAQEALRIRREMKSLHRTVHSLAQLAEFWIARGELDRGVPLLIDALEGCEQGGYRTEAGTFAISVARACAPDAAERFSEMLEDRGGPIASLCRRIRILLDLELSCVGAAEEKLDEDGAEEKMATLDAWIRARVHLLKEKPSRAVEGLSEALDRLAAERTSGSLREELRLLLAEALLEAGDPDRAAEVMETVLHPATGLGGPHVGEYWYLRGRLALARGDEEAAFEALDRAAGLRLGARLPWRAEAALADIRPDRARRAVAELSTLVRSISGSFNRGLKAELKRLPRPETEEEEPTPARPALDPDEVAESLRLVRDRRGILGMVRRVLEAGLDLERALEAVLSTVLDVTGAERGFLVILEKGTPKVFAAANLNEEEMDSPSFRVSRRIVEDACKKGEPILIGDALGDASYGKQQSVIFSSARSVLCVPLGTPPVGAIYVDDSRQRDAFGSDILTFVSELRDLLAPPVENALAHELEIQRREALDRSFRYLENEYDYDRIVGESDAMVRVFRLMDKVLETEHPVVIYGESGTGKELIARALHFQGPRAQEAFIGENCAALPADVLESELFGHKKGAFTGATSDRKGLFELADGGTLFLDEVGEMSPGMQKKLLRVLEERVVRRIGDSRPIPFDVRIISATNRDLRKLIQKNEFRADLYYRLNVITIPVPPLRDRREDIPLLCEHFLESIREETGREIRLSRPAISKLGRLPWPGNVRQLKNTIERAAVLGTGRIIGPDDIRVEETSSEARRQDFDIPKKIRGRKRKILEHLLEAGVTTSSEMAEMLDVSNRTALRDLKALLKEGLIQKEGSRRGSRYYLK